MADVIKKEGEVNKEHFQKGQMAKSTSWLRKGKKQQVSMESPRLTYN